MTFDPAQIARVRARLAEVERPEEPPLTTEELQDTWDRGNQRLPLPPNRSDNTKANIIEGQDRWISFCESLGRRDWKLLLATLSWRNRGLVESFVRFLMRREQSRITAIGAIRRYARDLWAVYQKHTGIEIEEKLKDHALAHIKLEVAPLFGLRVEPKDKNHVGPDCFTYLAYFRWVRDRTAFKIGLDRLDDALIRIFLMWTGCRRHELVYAQPKNRTKKIARYNKESGAYAKIDNDSDRYIQKRPKDCWVCGGQDERTDAAHKVLCWEDINLLILRDPERNGGRDCLALQVLLRFHKNSEKQMVPTWFTFIEEKLPVLCPVSHLLAKALAEGVIERGGYDSAETFFQTKLSIPAVTIKWKPEFLHKPVFRKTVDDSFGAPTKSDEPLRAATFDNNSGKLGTPAGLPDKLQSYDYRRGNLEVLDKNYRQSVRDQGARHRPNSTVYQRYYHNARANAIPQDAALGRGTESAYLDILNHIGLRYDENAPQRVTDEFMEAVGPDATVRRLDGEIAALQAELQERYGSLDLAPDADRKRYKRKLNERRVARQTQRRKVYTVIRKEHFDKRNDDELDRQLHGIHTPQQPLRKVIFSLSERRRIADILSDLDEDLPEHEILRRKIDAINAWVDYAWKIEPKEPDPVPIQTEGPLPSKTPQTIPGRPIAPRPWYTSMIQDPVSPSAPAMRQDPPPPYAEVDSRGPLDAAGRNDSGTHSRPQAPQHKCLFCGKCFTRKGAMWDCAERHLKRLKGEAVPCPHPECKGTMLEDDMRFKNHAMVVHNTALRPKIIILPKTTEGSTVEKVKSGPKIILVQRRSRKIVLRAGRETRLGEDQ